MHEDKPPAMRMPGGEDDPVSTPENSAGELKKDAHTGTDEERSYLGKVEVNPHDSQDMDGTLIMGGKEKTSRDLRRQLDDARKDISYIQEHDSEGRIDFTEIEALEQNAKEKLSEFLRAEGNSMTGAEKEAKSAIDRLKDEIQQQAGVAG